MNSITCDVLIIGGGVNGTGIARDAAGRGLSVVLCEKDDLAAHTSSASSKLIHGGLRYLEYYEFALVRKALRERETLLKSAPHIMWPLRFVMPHDAGQRPAWLMRAGLFLYDHLAPREFLGASQAIDLRRHPAGAPLKPAFVRAFEYADGWVDDARLVVLNAVDARAHGAQVFTRTTCISAERGQQHWLATLRSGQGEPLRVQARCLVNAGGPWAGRLQRTLTGAPAHHQLRAIKGSHIVVPRLCEHGYAYLFQHPDGRIVFALPFQQQFTLIGTTDVEYSGDLDRVAITAQEIDYLCTLASHYFRRAVTPDMVLSTYAGVRPILEDEQASASAATRDYRLEHDVDGAPLLTVWGGKITTFRVLAEQAVDWIAPRLGVTAGPWTAQACLPGGDLFGEGPVARNVQGFDTFVEALQARHAWLPPALCRRYARAYGSRCALLLEGVKDLAGLGEEVLPGLYAREIDYLRREEWACAAEDILWRRTKLGLKLPAGAAEQLALWLEAKV
ncbi:glycerol-3-phosphate dehydrogenase [Massilia sp. TS11]|uniref:glycerol-3-phosphate dehydrogenase n=1 Tax=Massilia sp. TS11 TaxID=2908003 RepID=UPI001EDAE411|nr:glycerol-3-phosphate dehydrogenase [Massilia sp. TS11]MCG2584008.1 glycerol-3-phosphate dehydrogenase [Massilia sp. TS11]